MSGQNKSIGFDGKRAVALKHLTRSRFTGMFDPETFPGFVARCPTPFHFVSLARELLLSHGYTELQEGVKWTDVPAKFFVVCDSRTVLAFNIRDTSRGIFLLSPDSSGCLATKPKTDAPNPNLSQFGARTRSQLHAASWFDRDLRIAGRALLSGGGSPHFRLFESTSPICVIPHVSPAFTVNMDNDLRPIISSTPQIDFASAIADAIGCPASEIIDFEALLIDAAPPALIGGDRELLNGQLVDVMSSALCSLFAFLAAGDPPSGFVTLGCFDGRHLRHAGFDRAGSASTFFVDTIARAGIGHEGIANSMMIAVENPPALDGIVGDGVRCYQLTSGTALTDFDIEVFLRGAALAENVALNFVTAKALNRPQVLLVAQPSRELGIRAGVIGVPVLAQGSIRETVAIKDAAALHALLTKVLASWTTIEPIEEIE
jgi:aspartyl aminopeptidase